MEKEDGGRRKRGEGREEGLERRKKGGMGERLRKTREYTDMPCCYDSGL